MSAFTALGPIQCFVCYCTVAHCFSLIDDISGDCFKFIGDILANDKKMLSFFFAVVVVVVGSGGWLVVDVVNSGGDGIELRIHINIY